MPLTEAGIYAAALRLIDADGVEALSMRKLATALDALGDAPWQERLRLLATDFRTLAHRHPKLMGYSFSHQADFIQPDDPFWVELTAILDAAGVPHPEVPQITALVGAVVTGVLTAELSGALHRWLSLKPPTAGEDGPTPPGRDGGRVFRLTVDTMIMGLESQLAAAGEGQGADL